MSIYLRMTTAAVRLWVRLYTLGLSAEVRQRRRLLMDSDLWEQMAEAAAEGSLATAASIAGRCIAGAPADLIWSLSVRTGRDSRPFEDIEQRRRRAMYQPRERFLALSALCGLAWALVCVAILQPTQHALAFTGGVVAIVALAGWALELRTDDETATASAWPPVLAVGVAAVGMGLVVEAPWAGLLISVPFAAITTLAWLVPVRDEIEDRRLAASLLPVSSQELAMRAASGDAIGLERTGPHRVPRRDILRAGLWLSIGSYIAAVAGASIDYLWERKPAIFGGIVAAGNASAFPPGTKKRIQEGRFWLVNLSAEQGGPGFLALWQKCPHLGCTVPWEPTFSFTDPATGDSKKGWFRCPCHQSTYNDAGVRVFGPAPRSMDRMQLAIDPTTKAITVDTGRITKGTTDNALYAVKPSDEPGSPGL